MCIRLKDAIYSSWKQFNAKTKSVPMKCNCQVMSFIWIWFKFTKQAQTALRFYHFNWWLSAKRLNLPCIEEFLVFFISMTFIRIYVGHSINSSYFWTFRRYSFYHKHIKIAEYFWWLLWDFVKVTFRTIQAPINLIVFSMSFILKDLITFETFYFQKKFAHNLENRYSFWQEKYSFRVYVSESEMKFNTPKCSISTGHKNTPLKITAKGNRTANGLDGKINGV